MAQGLELLEKLSLAFGPSGCERNVADLIRSEIAPYCDDLRTDALGNVIALYRGAQGDGGRLMLAAHMDEVGFMVTHIDDDGYVHFGTVGGVDERVLCGRRVVLGDETKKISGVIASKAIHQQKENERKEATAVENMYVDIGAAKKEEAEKFVEAGDFGVFDSEFIRFGNNMLKAKALDDRFGCAVMIETLRRLYEESKRLPYDTYFAFTVREEIGLAGSVTAAYAVEPDKAIVLEATAVADMADVPEQSQVAHIGEGGVITIADNGTIYDRDFVDFALATGARHTIKCQIKKYVSGSNDANHIHKSRAGVKTLAISAPCRYIHTASNVIQIDDYSAVKELVYSILCDLDINF